MSDTAPVPATPPQVSVRALLTGAPRPLLSTTHELALGARHRQVLDGLEQLLLDGELAASTIGALAARLECSRRTLYELAPSKDQLFLLALDRFMHRIGREALESIDPAATPAAQLRQYVTADVRYAFQAAAYDDLSDVPGARRLLDRHLRFAATVIERLVENGIELGAFRALEPSVVAAVLVAGRVRLADPDVTDEVSVPLDAALDHMLDLCLQGLANPPVGPGGQRVVD